jgi:hypothetical protein
MLNLYRQFRELVPEPALQVGTVIDVGNGGVTVRFPGGGQLKARGEAQINQRVFVRNGLIESIAPNLTPEIIDI